MALTVFPDVNGSVPTIVDEVDEVVSLERACLLSSSWLCMETVQKSITKQQVVVE